MVTKRGFEGCGDLPRRSLQKLSEGGMISENKRRKEWRVHNKHATRRWRERKSMGSAGEEAKA
jgi:hypothetical protein